MDGVKLNSLKIITHPKGDILHAVKSSSKDFGKFGEAYFSMINFREIKGWKMHTEMVLNFVVPIGQVKVVVFDGENYLTTILSKSNYQRLTIGPNLWVAFKGLSKINLILNIASIEHNPKESISKDLNELDYDWN
jgi:dTDP-4-dehydrorhamnose 3,5-epimerase|tara:strand:- start:575 stop:979 length:405 start_codon:yes stop_codon:yes gene_type:complete